MNERRRIAPGSGLETRRPESGISHAIQGNRRPHDPYYEEPDSVQRYYARNSMRLRRPRLKGPDHDMSRYESARYRR